MSPRPARWSEPEPPPTFWEDPRFSIYSLTPGQRYTSVLAVAFALALLAFGVPHHGRNSVLSGNSSTPACAAGSPAAGSSSPGCGQP